MIAAAKMGKRSGSEVGARALGRVNAGRDWRAGMERGRAEAKWRRVTGISCDHEGAMDRAELKCAGRRLVKWVERFFERERAAGAEGMPLRCAAWHGTPEGGVTQRGDGPLVPRKDGRRKDSGVETRGRDARATGGDGAREEAAFSVEGAASEGWACARGHGGALARVCAALGIPAARFNGITKALINITAGEFVDGLHLRGVRGALRSRVVAAAKELWGEPGSRTVLRVMDGELKVTKPAGTWMVWPGRGVVRDVYAQRAERVRDLFARVEAAWRDGTQDRQAFALALGFADFSRLNKACLNVDGESVRQKIRRLCRDVVDYFLAAEAKVLRELAMCERESEAVIRARWLYSGSVERCGELADYWNAMECGRADVLEEMRGAAGPAG